jgi:hypothetical protein
MRSVLVGACAATAAVVVAAPAYADRAPNPHMPNTVTAPCATT